MRFETIRRHDRTGENVKISPVSAAEQTSRVHEAVAQRAYQISETHKGATAQETRDWLQAESEVIHPCCWGQMPMDGSLWLETDANAFAEDTIEIWVGPHQLTVCGKPRPSGPAFPIGQSGSSPVPMIYEVFNLPVGVDPTRVTAKVTCSALEILLGKANRERETEQKLSVAA